MRLADLFRPKYRSSNPENRLKAVAEMTCQKMLAELAQTDPSPRVRLAAVEKITNQELLKTIALSGTELDARIAAVERIDSQETLAEIIKVRRNYQLMGACFARITDTAILDKIANDTGYNLSARRMAIENYAEESFLEDMLPTNKKNAPKTPEEIDALITRYGAANLARGLGKFRGSPNAMIALGEIMKRGGEAGMIAIDNLTQGLIHANKSVQKAAFEQLIQLSDTEMILHLIRLMDKASLYDKVFAVLKEINHPEAKNIVNNA